MNHETNKISANLDKLILFFLTVQIASVSLSIAASSISFGIWCGLWIIQIIITRNIGIDKKLFEELRIINLFILLYIFAEIISRVFAVFPEGAIVGLKRLLLFLIFFVAVIKVFNKKMLYRMLLSILIIVALVSVYEIIRYSFKLAELIDEVGFVEVRIDFISYPLTSGQIKMMLLMTVFPLLFIKEKLFVKKGYLLLILAPIALSMFFTQSRNVFLAVFICFLVYGIFINRKFLITVLVVTGVFLIFAPSEYQSRFRSIVNPDHPSNRTRIVMWETGYKIFKDHPVIGAGDSHITEVYKLYRTPEYHGEGSHLHSNIFMVLATSGLIGFAGFIGYFISLFIKQVRIYKREKNPPEKALAFGGILVTMSFFIAGLTEWSFGDHEVMTVFFFLSAIPFILLKFNLNECKEE